MQVTFMQVTVIDIWENWDLISGLSELRKFEAGRTGFNKVDSTYTEGWKMKLELIEITNGRKGTPIDVIQVPAGVAKCQPVRHNFILKHETYLKVSQKVDIDFIEKSYNFHEKQTS